MAGSRPTSPPGFMARIRRGSRVPGPLRSQRRGGHRLQRHARLAAEYPAGLGQRDRAAGPLEQGDAQPAF